MNIHRTGRKLTTKWISLKKKKKKSFLSLTINARNKPVQAGGAQGLRWSARDLLPPGTCSKLSWPQLSPNNRAFVGPLEVSASLLAPPKTAVSLAVKLDGIDLH